MQIAKPLIYSALTILCCAIAIVYTSIAIISSGRAESKIVGALAILATIFYVIMMRSKRSKKMDKV